MTGANFQDLFKASVALLQACDLMLERTTRRLESLHRQMQDELEESARVRAAIDAQQHTLRAWWELTQRVAAPLEGDDDLITMHHETSSVITTDPQLSGESTAHEEQTEELVEPVQQIKIETPLEQRSTPVEALPIQSSQTHLDYKTLVTVRTHLEKAIESKFPADQKAGNHLQRAREKITEILTSIDKFASQGMSFESAIKISPSNVLYDLLREFDSWVEEWRRLTYPHTPDTEKRISERQKIRTSIYGIFKTHQTSYIQIAIPESTREPLDRMIQVNDGTWYSSEPQTGTNSRPGTILEILRPAYARLERTTEQYKLLQQAILRVAQ